MTLNFVLGIETSDKGIEILILWLLLQISSVKLITDFYSLLYNLLNTI